jgi:DNA-binding response OmpR family regulator/nitrogen-specific signal transduction histidine kinase
MAIYLIFYTRKKIEIRKIEDAKREEMHQLKLQFFTNISHEFRTPLSLIIGPLEKMEKENHHPTFKHYYKIMYRNANRLMGLISELMDFRKAESGALKLKVKQSDLGVFLNQIAEEFTVSSQHKRINFTVRQTDSLGQVWFDHQVVEKIILNLLANSFKYTDLGGTISMEILSDLADFKSAFQNKLVVKSGFKTSSFVYIRIIDSGIGISKESIKHLFERFYRIEESHMGSGVGLAFVKTLTFLHKGEIYVFSEFGKGTEIIIALPKDRDDYNSDELWTDSNSSGGVQIESINYKYESSLPCELESKFLRRESDSLPERSKYILVIDDNSELRDFLHGNLDDLYFISEADNGNSGLMKIRETLPDLVISDIMMPGMDGIELCRIVKNDIEISHIPFMLLTARDSLESKLEGVGSGADYYFEKPLNINLLLLTIKNIFDQKDKLKERYLKDYQTGVRELVNSDIDKEFIDKLINLLEAEFENPDMNVKYLCVQIGMSKTSLYKKIKKITGQSINEFIRTTRLKKAVDIMIHEDILITDVMYRVGILSQSYFTTAFKKQFGKTPSQFLQELDKRDQ